jgi:hypothetical protein
VASLLPGFNWSKGYSQEGTCHYSCTLMPSSGRKGTARGISINAKRAQQHYCSGTDGAHGGRECRSGACLHVARAVVIPRGTMTSTPMGHMTARAYPSESVRGHALNAEGASMQHDHKAGWACSLAAALHCWRRSGQPPRRHRRRHLRARLHLMQQAAWQACLPRRSSSLGASASLCSPCSVLVPPAHASPHARHLK